MLHAMFSFQTVLNSVNETSGKGKLMTFVPAAIGSSNMLRCNSMRCCKTQHCCLSRSRLRSRTQDQYVHVNFKHIRDTLSRFQFGKLEDALELVDVFNNRRNNSTPVYPVPQQFQQKSRALPQMIYVPLVW